MSNHPNRGRRPTPASRPPPEAIRARRRELRMTQRAAAEVVYGTEVAWRSWESGERPMHPATWELFRIKTLDAQVLRALGLTPVDPAQRTAPASSHTGPPHHQP